MRLEASILGESSKSLPSHRNKSWLGLPSPPSLPRVGARALSHLQCLFGDGVSLQTGDHFQHCHHVPDLKKKNHVSVQGSALYHGKPSSLGPCKVPALGTTQTPITLSQDSALPMCTHTHCHQGALKGDLPLA